MSGNQHTNNKIEGPIMMQSDKTQFNYIFHIETYIYIYIYVVPTGVCISIANYFWLHYSARESLRKNWKHFVLFIIIFVIYLRTQHSHSIYSLSQLVLVVLNCQYKVLLRLYTISVRQTTIIINRNSIISAKILSEVKLMQSRNKMNIVQFKLAY